MLDSVPELPDPDISAAQAVAYWFSPTHCAIVWRDGPQHLRPVDADRSVCDIRAGDEVVWRDELRVVRSVTVYR